MRTLITTLLVLFLLSAAALAVDVNLETETILLENDFKISLDAEHQIFGDYEFKDIKLAERIVIFGGADSVRLDDLTVYFGVKVYNGNSTYGIQQNLDNGDTVLFYRKNFQFSF